MIGVHHPRYDFLLLLGVGGAGEVYRVFDREAGELRALKVLDAEACADPRMRQRFLSEARFMAALDHPHILPIYDAGSFDDERAYLVMELARQTLGSWAEEQPSISGVDVWRVATQALAALEAAHGRHIIHRDVKPDNLLWADEGVLKLSDFGIARFDRAVGSDLTRTGEELGTIGFMAPEQRVDARAVSPQSDLYGLGATLYAVLTQDLRPPPDLYAMDEGSRWMRRLPAAWRSLIVRATRRDPGMRYGSAQRMAACLPAPDG